MARICAVTGRRPVKGSIINRKGQSKKSGGIGTHVTSITKRKFRPNLQRIRIKTANGGTNDISLLTGKGGGTFNAAVPSPIGIGGVRWMAGADPVRLPTVVAALRE